MKKSIFRLYALSFLLFSCSDDPTEELSSPEEANIVAETIQFDPERAVDCVLTTNSDCGLPGSTITFNFIPDPPSANVIWTINSGNITAILGSGTTQSFNLGTNFTGGQISAIGGSFGCKDTYMIVPCDIGPSCSISGPSCGTSGDTVTLNFNGASSGQNVTWNTQGSGITITAGQGTASATFSLGSSFNGGTISASTFGFPSCSAIFPLADCCQSRIITITDENVLLRNE